MLGRTPHPLRRLLGGISVATLTMALTACGDDGSSTAAGTVTSPSETRAASNDRLEPGMSGRVPLQTQLSGDATQGFRRGLRLVGQNTIMNRGANFALAWVDDCAYVTTTSGQQTFGVSNTPFTLPQDFPLNGMAVIDASDPRNPELVDIIQSPVMKRAHESLRASETRKIIVATSSAGNKMEVYDASNCREPVLRSTLTLGTGVDLPLATVSDGLPSDVGGQFTGHALCLAPDGMTAYATGVPTSNAIIDLTDLDNPEVIKLFTPSAHDCGVSPDGNRLHLAVFSGILFGTAGGGLSVLTSASQGVAALLGNLTDNATLRNLLDDFSGDQNINDGANGQLGNQGFNGLITADVSEVQARRENPEIRAVGRLRWTPQSENEHPAAGSHTAHQFRVGDRTYVYSSDEWPVAGEFGACPWAHGRIIDITDESRPREVADIKLDVHKPENCAETTLDAVNYSAHYVGFDDASDASLLFTTWYSAGLRVHDISDPSNPVEIAYFHPAPVSDVPPALSSPVFGATPTVDAVPTYVRYRPETGHIWIAGTTSGFQILELTASAGPQD